MTGQPRTLWKSAAGSLLLQGVVALEGRRSRTTSGVGPPLVGDGDTASVPTRVGVGDGVGTSMGSQAAENAHGDENYPSEHASA